MQGPDLHGAGCCSTSGRPCHPPHHSKWQPSSSRSCRHQARRLHAVRRGEKRNLPSPDGPEYKSPGLTREFVKSLEEDAKFDEEIAELLAGANGDPNIIEQRMEESMKMKQERLVSDPSGAPGAMQVSFRGVDPFNTWLWFEMYHPPTEREVSMLEEVLTAWFLIGRLGGFDATNLQVLQNGGGETSFMEYDSSAPGEGFAASFHDMSTMETKGTWCRCWVNMGVADELCLDVLINSLVNFSTEHLGIKQLLVGGKNPDWETPKISEIPDLMDSVDRVGARPKKASAVQRAAKGDVGKASGADDDEFGWGDDEGYS